jgi:hypothetical protein
VEDRKAEIRKAHLELYFIVFLCMVGIGVEILAYCSVLKPNSESAASWFARSGAITSIFCIFAQLRLSSFLESRKGVGFEESWWLFKLFKKRHDVISWAVVFVAMWGAVVWGYGDLFVKCFVRLQSWHL